MTRASHTSFATAFVQTISPAKTPVRASMSQRERLIAALDGLLGDEARNARAVDGRWMAVHHGTDANANALATTGCALQ